MISMGALFCRIFHHLTEIREGVWMCSVCGRYYTDRLDLM